MHRWYIHIGTKLLVYLMKKKSFYFPNPNPNPNPNPKRTRTRTFRLVFTSLIKEPCRYKIDGWIYNSPYIIDLKNKESVEKYARNRIEVGIPYTEVEKFIARKPSLRKAMANEKPVLLVKSFKIEDHKSEVTGGTEKVGIAEIIDYPISNKSYKISSQSDTTITPFHILQFDHPRSTKSIIISSRDLNKTVEINNMIYNFKDADLEKRTVTVSRTNNNNGLIIEKTLKAPETINFSRSVKKLPTRQTVQVPVNSKIVKPTVRHPVPSRPLKDYNTYYGRGSSEKEAYYEARKQIKRNEQQHSYRFRKTGLTWTCTLYATTGK